MEGSEQSAAEALGKVGHADPQAVIPALLEALKDEEWVSEQLQQKPLVK